MAQLLSPIPPPPFAPPPASGEVAPKQLLGLEEPQQQEAFLACQQAWEVGEGAGLLLRLLVVSHAPPLDVQCRDLSRCGAPWVAHRSSASVLCN